MTTDKCIKISDAAKQLKISNRKLLEQLRANMIFNGTLPREKYINDGYFRIENREFTLPGTRIKKPYTIALVTGKGMALLNDIINNEVDKNRQLLRTKRLRISDQRCPRPGENTLQRVVSSN